jgi:membrane fusion protein, heavy metal efflux system
MCARKTSIDMAPSRNPCWSRPKTPRRTTGRPDRGGRAVEDSGRRQERSQRHRPVYAPISGVIIAQNVTIAAAPGVNLSGNATAFTIADLSSVWIVCDVYENDIPKLTLGQTAQIKTHRLSRQSSLTGRVSDIGPCSIPTFAPPRCALRLPNPGILKLGMFVTATFESKTKEKARRGAALRGAAPA